MMNSVIFSLSFLSVQGVDLLWLPVQQYQGGHIVWGPVGGVQGHLPGNIVHPIIFASETTQHVLGEVKNHFVPEAKREASEKWKTNQ